MMRSLYRLLLILIAMPAVLALAHDLYAYHQNIDPEAEFKLNPAGYFWATYDPASLRMASTSLDPALWGEINKILVIEGVYVFGILALGIYFVLMILRKLFFRGSNSFEEYDRLSFLHDNTSKRSGYKYRRKR
jgi:hypothetical protein